MRGAARQDKTDQTHSLPTIYYKPKDMLYRHVSGSAHINMPIICASARHLMQREVYKYTRKKLQSEVFVYGI